MSGVGKESVAMSRGDAAPHQRSLLERLPLERERPWLGYAGAAVLDVAALLLREAIPISEGYPFLTFFPATVGIAFLFGWRAGVFSVLLSAALAAYFLIAPVGSFGIGGQAALAVVFFAGTAAMMIFLIHWMQRAYARLEKERRLSAALAENRELLFRELQHRVSNNLQVVAALLALQKKGIADPDAQLALEEASRRLGLIGRIHRQLYEPSGARIGMAPFLRELAADVIDSAGRAEARLEVEADEAVDLRSDAAIPVALIVAEAIANAVEHGFAGRDAGTVRVTMARADGGGAVVEVADNGVGLPAGFDPEATASLGLRIATMLARQLGGRFELSNGEGAVARLTLPASALA